MNQLLNASIGSIVTVRSIKGGLSVRKKLEDVGIMAGSDLRIVSVSDDKKTVTVDCGRGDIQLDEQDIANIKVSEQFRRNNDPVLLGGCCAYGNTGDMIERIEETYNQMEKDHK